MTGSFVLKRSDDQFIFNLKAAGNSEIILTGERYTRKASALEGIAAIRENASANAHYQRRTSHAGEPYFVLKAANGEVLGTSEMYSSRSARDGGIAAVQQYAESADVHDVT